MWISLYDFQEDKHYPIMQSVIESVLFEHFMTSYNNPVFLTEITSETHLLCIISNSAGQN